MTKDSVEGPACSLKSKPSQEISRGNTQVRRVTLEELTHYLGTSTEYVVIVEALWCGDCHRQAIHLDALSEQLRSVGIELIRFVAEGDIYDQFLSTAHHALTMKLYGTPLGGSILADTHETDTNSVIATRGREAYPGLFYVRSGILEFWSIEDSTEAKLARVVHEITSRKSRL